MATDRKDRKEHPSTYFVQDRANEAERTRITLQDALVTQEMGGVLPEQADPIRFHRILDVGCGSGGWLIAVAREVQRAMTLVGIDVSRSMIALAKEQARDAGVEDRVEFHVMDALRMLEFPRDYFDLVNHRFNFSYLRTWDWPNLLQEYQRVTHPGGIIRITEPDVFADSNSSAFNQLCDLGREAFFKSGHLFEKGREGVIGSLPTVLKQSGIGDIQTRLIEVHYTHTSNNLPVFRENNKLAFRIMTEFLRKWGRIPSDYDQLYQQALTDMQQPDFQATARMITAWGTKIHIYEKPLMVDHH